MSKTGSAGRRPGRSETRRSMDRRTDLTGVPVFPEAAERLDAIRLRRALFGGFQRKSVYAAIQQLDGYYTKAAARYREQLQSEIEQLDRTLLDENTLLEMENEYLREALQERGGFEKTAENPDRPEGNAETAENEQITG